MAVYYNCGCGSVKKKGYINIDSARNMNPDIVADIRKIPWKWAKAADLIEFDNVAEHFDPYTWIRIVRECHRVLKPNGILWIKVPVLNPANIKTSIQACFSDPTHINFFTTESFDYYDRRHIRWLNYGRAYEIPPFERIDQKIGGRFLIVRLRVVK